TRESEPFADVYHGPNAAAGKTKGPIDRRRSSRANPNESRAKPRSDSLSRRRRCSEPSVLERVTTLRPEQEIDPRSRVLALARIRDDADRVLGRHVELGRDFDRADVLRRRGVGAVHDRSVRFAELDLREH